ncbi:hypothetical protein OO007_14325 [Cocleimonas sp. KMM 6892]|uniref:hypothetical protein n=1 Tax=unclassified Cocleimonas TaxID=2639732 RepID=UPI002DBAAFC3|nr:MULTISPECIES: hypothetical protein [unclassified Cocleimonas]MEB8433413.1 hypothetical protein [Cocleimonas sp. KMM 6892]MEC4716224.1 hypothetical protein [Cocleimonas sp. KMM 6895]MEC4745883.1 hypothetical protein [Cocleimonas sp. KMM 6896]
MSNPNPTTNNTFKLEEKIPFDGFSQQFDGINVSELLGYSMVSMAFSSNSSSQDKKPALVENIKAAYDAELPEVGKFTTSAVDNTRILSVQQDQCFVLFENETVYQNCTAVAHIQEKVKDSAYLSDQSDSWAMLKISGSNTRAALERICSINLQPSSDASGFGPFSVTRTSMEYLGVIIMQVNEPVAGAEDEYLLFSPRSSADAFLHMILTSIENVS